MASSPERSTPRSRSNVITPQIPHMASLFSLMGGVLLEPCRQPRLQIRKSLLRELRGRRVVGAFNEPRHILANPLTVLNCALAGGQPRTADLNKAAATKHPVLSSPSGDTAIEEPRVTPPRSQAPSFFATTVKQIVAPRRAIVQIPAGESRPNAGKPRPLPCPGAKNSRVVAADLITHSIMKQRRDTQVLNRLVTRKYQYREVFRKHALLTETQHQRRFLASISRGKVAATDSLQPTMAFDRKDRKPLRSARIVSSKQNWAIRRELAGGYTRSKVPGKVQVVYLASINEIVYKPEARLQVKEQATVNHRVWQTPIPGVAALEQVERLSNGPAFHRYSGKQLPGERSRRLGLIEPVHLQGVMRQRTPEEISLAFGRYVTKGPRIHQPIMPVNGELHAERVGMTMSGCTGALSASIDYESLRHRLGNGHHVDSTGTQPNRGWSGAGRLQLLEFDGAFWS